MRAVGRGHRLKKEKWARECNRGRVPATWLSMTRRVIVGFGIVLVGCGPLMPSVDDSMSAADETGAHHGTTSGASAGVTGNGPATGEDVTTGSADETTADDSSQPKLDVSPACVSSDDCILLDTCCGCDAAPGDRPPPDRCPRLRLRSVPSFTRLRCERREVCRDSTRVPTEHVALRRRWLLGKLPPRLDVPRGLELR